MPARVLEHMPDRRAIPGLAGALTVDDIPGVLAALAGEAPAGT